MRKKQKITIIQIIKTIPLIIIIFGVGLYQVQWFQGLQQLVFTYDFSGVYPEPQAASRDFGPSPAQFNGLSPPQGEGLEEFSKTMVDYLVNNDTALPTVNLTAAEKAVLQNATVIDPIQDYLEQLIDEAKQIYEAFISGDLLYDLFLDFVRELWRLALAENLPEAWDNPVELNVLNNGTIPFKQLDVYGNFFWNETLVQFLSLSNRTLPPGETLEISIILNDIIRAITELLFEELVELTITWFLENLSTALADFPTFFRLLLLNQDLHLYIKVEAIIGIITSEIIIDVDFDPFLEDFVEEEIE